MRITDRRSLRYDAAEDHRAVTHCACVTEYWTPRQSCF
jgi:hypothetical protein